MTDPRLRPIARILRAFARALLRRYRPTLVAITGSVGKTSTREAVFAVLGQRGSVRRSEKNYNNELGVPLTIIGAESGERSPWRWLGVFARALGLLLARSPSYPATLILELGSDRRGDIAYLMEMISPVAVGVLTAVAPVHTEFLGTLEDVLEEKRPVITRLPRHGAAVLNADDARVQSLAEKTPARVVTFGFAAAATVHALEVRLSSGDSAEGAIRGTSLKLQKGDTSVPVFLPGVIGQHQVYAPLAAAAVGVSLGMNLVEIAERLRTYRPPPGRMVLLPGVKATTILDDSYNASPVAMVAALATLAEFPTAGRRIACLGTMAELGDLTKEAHAEIGRTIARQPTDLLLTVGAEARDIAAAAVAAGYSAEKTFSFSQAEEAGRFLQERLQHGDLILVKGSQSVRLEKIVKEVMAEPERAGELLVRQNQSWLAR